MENRKGEKIGWVGGWLGGFLWVAVLAVVFLFQGKILQAVSGMGLAAAATACALRFVPWRFPETPYWKLIFPVSGKNSPGRVRDGAGRRRCGLRTTLRAVAFSGNPILEVDASVLWDAFPLRGMGDMGDMGVRRGTGIRVILVDAGAAAFRVLAPDNHRQAEMDRWPDRIASMMLGLGRKSLDKAPSGEGFTVMRRMFHPAQ